MPCTYYTAREMEKLREDANMKSINTLQVSLDSVTAMLCKLCATLDQERADWTMPPEIRTWWTKHQEKDKRDRILTRFNAARKAMDIIEQRILDIQALGGVPSIELKAAFDAADEELTAAAKDSNQYR